MIDTHFWDDPWVVRSTPAERYLYLYLLTCPLTNLAGIYEITDGRISGDTGLTIADLKLILDSFRRANKVFRFEDFIVLRNWPKRQRLRNPKIQAGIERILDTLPKELLTYLVEIDYQYPKLADVVAKIAPKTLITPAGYDMPIISHFTSLHFTQSGGQRPAAALLTKKENFAADPLFKTLEELRETVQGGTDETEGLPL